MYAPKMKDMTRDERWQAGLNWRIDSMADAALAEIRTMADEARAAFKVIHSAPLDTRLSDAAALVNIWNTPLMADYARIQQGMRAMSQQEIAEMQRLHLNAPPWLGVFGAAGLAATQWWEW